MEPSHVDWEALFGVEGARWFHTGGIFVGLSDSTAEAALKAIHSARGHGTVVSYDLNYRPSLWRRHGGAGRAREVNLEILPLVDVLVGNEEDFELALGFHVEGTDANLTELDTERFGAMLARVAAAFPNLKMIATTLRAVRTATINDWSAACHVNGELLVAAGRRGLEVLDRVGGGDAFLSGFIYGLLTGQTVPRALELGVAHGALAMTTPGDTTMATLAEVEALTRGASPRILR
jgi:2-dehydro-3-deoxygluconokinase